MDTSLQRESPKSTVLDMQVDKEALSFDEKLALRNRRINNLVNQKSSKIGSWCRRLLVACIGLGATQSTVDVPRHDVKKQAAVDAGAKIDIRAKGDPLRRLDENDPDDALVFQGMQRLHHGDADAAIDILTDLERKIGVKQMDPIAINALAEAYEKKLDWSTALEYQILRKRRIEMMGVPAEATDVLSKIQKLTFELSKQEPFQDVPTMLDLISQRAALRIR